MRYGRTFDKVEQITALNKSSEQAFKEENSHDLYQRRLNQLLREIST